MNRNWIPVAGTAAAIVAVAVCNMPVETKPQPVPAGLEQFGPLDYSYEIVGDTFIIHAKGSISYNEAVAFNQFRKTWENVPLGNVKRVALSLDSYGGSIVGAADMAEWVRANKVETIVPNKAMCVSACVMVWGAGYHKWASETAQIGVHNASASNSDPEKAAAEAEGTLFMAKALAKEGAPAAVVGALTMTESKDVHWLKSDDVVAWGATVIDKDGKSL
jgi:hypothetical protein